MFVFTVSECVKLRSQFSLLNDKGQTPTADDPMTMCKPLRHDVFASGILTLRPLHSKPKQRVNKDMMVCDPCELAVI